MGAISWWREWRIHNTCLHTVYSKKTLLPINAHVFDMMPMTKVTSKSEREGVDPPAMLWSTAGCQIIRMVVTISSSLLAFTHTSLQDQASCPLKSSFSIENGERAFFSVNRLQNVALSGQLRLLTLGMIPGSSVLSHACHHRCFPLLRPLTT